MINFTSLLRRTKNWLRRVKKRNKLKKPLSSLPADFQGDARLYYYNTYNINLFDYKVRRRFNVSSLPQYNYGYDKAIQLYQQSQLRSSRPMIFEGVSPKTNSSGFFAISRLSRRDREVINNPSIFFTRLTPPL
ncbi:hypothetical protein RhiirA4_482900 [Rhizophagus irregularis]|uniref:Uncharacterized protein n=1 Tax=Rhizophagus irregularis TaxID=588596 RepID=A0A2I1HLT7_9GLOM|nr:hypothetical protein RhiirA4_482900 [Rhizophagus irregularis]